MKVQKTLKIKNRLGLHVRAVTQLIKTVEPFNCDILIDREGFEQVNGKSIMSVLTIAAPKGSKITVTTEGPEAEEALQAIEELINNNFGEED